MGDSRINNKKKKRGFLAAALVVVIILFGAGAELLRTFGSNKSYADLGKLLGLESEDEWAVLLNDRYQEVKAYEKDGTIYFPIEFVSEAIDERFYYDTELSSVLYALPDCLVRIGVDEKVCLEGQNEKPLNTAGLVLLHDSYCISLELIDAYSDSTFSLNDENRIVWVFNRYDEEIQKCKVSSDGKKLRKAASIRSEIVADLSADEEVTLVSGSGSFSQVITEKGIIGYIQSKNLVSTEAEHRKNEKPQREYTALSLDSEVVMGWHQMDEYNYELQTERLLELIKSDKLNVVSPTWYSVASEDGELNSFASAEYAAKAHELGLKVWALVDNFNADVDNYKLLSSYSARQRMIERLVGDALTLGFDGINIDFEAKSSGLGGLDSSCGVHFTEFLRELSVFCRANGLYLSVDNYIPTTYNQYYNLTEQGKIVDYVIIMAYDEHYAGSKEAGSVSSYSFVSSAVKNTLGMVGADKVILAVPFYTRLWSVTDGTVLSSEAKGAKAMQELLKENGVQTVYKDEEHQNYAEYTQNNITQKVWLEDDTSMSFRVDIAVENKLAGISAWKLGLEPDSFWSVIGRLGE